MLERLDPGNPRATSPALCVKRNVRNVADKDKVPGNFRTQTGLQRARLHLRELVGGAGARFIDVYKFLWDRYRQVRAGQ